MRKSKAKDGQVSNLTFHYIKSNQYREIFATGAHGGPTPEGYIHFSLYNQRFPIPLQTVHRLIGEHQLGTEIKDQRVSRDGIIRSVEAGVYMSPKEAEVFAKWLLSQVVEAKKKIGEAEAARVKATKRPGSVRKARRGTN